MFKGRKIMKKKVVGIIILILVIVTAIPAVGIVNNALDEKPTAHFTHLNTPLQAIVPSFFQSSCVVWDNHVEYMDRLFHAQDEPPEAPNPEDCFHADDFQFNEETDVYWVYWAQGYYMCNSADGPKDYHYDWNITFYVDDGSGYRPGAVYAGPFTFSDADIIKGEELFNSTADAEGIWITGAGVLFSGPVTFLADTKYWISVYSLGRHYPYSGWVAHKESTGGILLNEAVWKSEYAGYPEWTNSSEMQPYRCDMNFLLGGELNPLGITLKKGFGITATVTNQLPEPYNETNVTVTFSITGGFVLNPTKTSFIKQLDVGATETVKFYPIGFGKITINVMAVASGAAAGRTNTSGLLVLFFVI